MSAIKRDRGGDFQTCYRARRDIDRIDSFVLPPPFYLVTEFLHRSGTAVVHRRLSQVTSFI